MTSANQKPFDRTFFANNNTKETLYRDYKTNLSTNFSTVQEDTYSKSTDDRLKDKWKKDPQHFYAYASMIRAEIELDFALLEDIMKDSAFAKLSPSAQQRVTYYYYDYAQLLLDDAHLANHRAERDKYQKIITEYNLKRRKETIAARKALNAQAVQLKVIEAQKNAEETWLAMLERWYAKLQKWFVALRQSLNEFATFHPSVVIDWIGYFNMYRLMTVFCRLTWKQFWLIGQKLGWLDQTGSLAGFHIDIAMMDAPTYVFNLLSVFLFLARFLVDFSKILKHFFNPTNAELGIDPWDRFRIEWNKRYGRIVNDLAWVLFNGLTNYAIYFNIPVPIASWLLAAFLVFDVWWLSYQLNVGEKVYAAKKQQLSVLSDASGEGEEKEILYLQLNQLEYRRAEMRGKLAFYMAAAALFVVSFALVLSVSSPWAGPVCFAACAFAVAMYLTGAQFGAAIRSGKERQRNLDDPSRSQSERKAWINFAKNLAENIVMPLLIVGLFTVHWPLAIAVTVIYIGIKHAEQLSTYVMPDKSNSDDEELVDEMHEALFMPSCPESN
ncbi:MAG: hypothetical protein Q8R24_03835 [Legionellaceae bacterium]|nr:hypothetical protein [Legionellaceae bacterium]